MNIKLIRPSNDFKNQYEEYKNEFKQRNEKFVDDKSNEPEESFEEWLKRVTDDSDEKTVSENWVLTDTFFIIRKTDNMLIGLCELRHSDDEIIKDFGQIAYEIRPTQRNKGYATTVISMLCNIAKSVNMNELYVSVEESNKGSIRTIEKNMFEYFKNFDYMGQNINVYKKVLNI